MRKFILSCTLAYGLGACAPADSGPTAADPVGTESDEIARRSTLELLANVPLGTTWASLDARIKRRLEANARRALDAYAARWSLARLRQREAQLLRRPTAAMTAAFDAFVRASFGAELPQETYQASREMDPGLRDVLKRLYLVRIAAWRLNVKTYGNLASLDWDGVTPLDDFPLPDPRAIDAYSAYARDALAALRALPAARLSPAEQAVRERATFYLRMHANGSTSSRYGDRDALTPWSRAGWSYDLMYAHTEDGGGFLQDDEHYIDTVNAYYFGPLERVDVGSVHAVPFWLETSTDPASVRDILGLDPATDARARAFVLLSQWFGERLAADPRARNACTVYTPAERRAAWDAFSADELFNNDGSSSLETFRGDLQTTTTALMGAYRDAVVAALEAFAATPASGVTPAQLAQAVAAVRAETRYGSVLATAHAALDRATGGTAASTAFRARFASIPSYGGYDAGVTEVRPADAAALTRIYADVRAFLIAEYGFDGARLDDAVNVTVSASPMTGRDGSVTAGIRRARDEASWYSVMLHEAHHSHNAMSDVFVEGAAWEGAALQVEDQVFPRFITWVLTRAGRAADAPFYIAQRLQARVGTLAKTDATLQVLLRDSCAGPNSVDFARNIGASWGVSGDADLDDVAVRSHHGTQYLQYSSGQIIYGGLLAYLGQQLGRPVDPFQLQACGVPFPSRTPEAVARIRTCLASRP